jgi:hypothetical protein
MDDVMDSVTLEAGQRWRYKDDGGALGGLIRLLTHKDPSHGWVAHGCPRNLLGDDYLRKAATLIAPTPAVGQRWRLNGGTPIILTQQGMDMLVQEQGCTGWHKSASTPVELAIWLLEQGAEYVGGTEAQGATPSGTAIRTSWAAGESPSWFLGGSALPAPAYLESCSWPSERCGFSASPSRVPALPNLPHEVPELYDGMRIRTCSTVYRISTEDAGVTWRMLYRGEPGSRKFSLDEARAMFRSGEWAWVPTSGERERATASLANAAPSQLHHIRALGAAVNAVLLPSTVADGRRSVDFACRQLRGEPFAEAIRAVLVAMVEVPHSPAVIASVIDGCRAWEDERSRVAPGRRELTKEQQLACETAAKRHIWTTNGGAVYERARLMCRS